MPIYKGKNGEISVRGDHQVEWTIKDIFSYNSKDECYTSTSFDISGYEWYLRFHPNGETGTESVGWISLYLVINESDLGSSKVAANSSFGVKKKDGSVEETRREEVSWLFEVEENQNQCGYGYPKLLLRSKLLRRRSEMAPSDALTLTCVLWVNDTVDSSTRLDTLSQDLLDMFLSEKNCDATLKVKDKTFSVHKAILSARSPVFATMFEIEMKEKKTGVVDIVDCHPDAFKGFLMYLYSGRIENISSNVFELYKIADKYDVRKLKSACLISMMCHLSVENVLDVAILGHRSSIQELKIKSQEFFNKNFKEIACSVKWESLLKEDYHLANELLKEMACK